MNLDAIDTTDVGFELSNRWFPIPYHPEIVRLWESENPRNIAKAGRRAYKSETMKRKGIIVGLTSPLPETQIIWAAPTRDQAKEIYWDSIKALTPDVMMAGDPRESDLTIKLVTGARLRVVGLDKPQRVEGGIIDWLCVDELAQMKPETYPVHLKPALDSVGRLNICNMIGIPRFGRGGTFGQMWKIALREGWGCFSWRSSDVLPASIIESARRELDPRTFATEYEAEFSEAGGAIYYTFEEQIHLRKLTYDPSVDLVFCFDFNVKPGSAAVVQEIDKRRLGEPPKGYQWTDKNTVTCVIGEVAIPDYSNTERVCQKLIADWKHHEGRVLCHGDPSGGARHTSAKFNDWQIIHEMLAIVGPFRPRRDGTPRVAMRQGRPPQADPKDLINSTCKRLRSADRKIGMLVDPDKAPWVVESFLGTLVQPGTDGEVLKTHDDADVTHWTDAISYYVHKVHPMVAMQIVRLPLR